MKDHKAQNKECVAFLIASETFSSKLQEVLLKEEDGLTSEEATLVLTSIKYGKFKFKGRSIYVFTTISLANRYHNISGKEFIQTDC